MSTLKRNMITKIIMKIVAETEESHEYVSSSNTLATSCEELTHWNRS